jgi:HD superfamily phosphohydrolase
LQAATKDCPSEIYIEELLRIAALFHDVGHGPFGHFFDDNVLDEYRVTHEMIGQQIIQWGVGKVIRSIRRSPQGPLPKDETLDPEYVAFLIGKGPNQPNHRYPQWLVFLQPLLSGIYTADNLDYVLRDAYMCGVAVGPVDLNRLIHYTFYSEKGMTLHRAGLSALNMFLNARLYMYTNVYYHRTTRAIDLHLKEIFRDTVKLLYPHNPIEKLEAYLDVTDWSLLESVRGWKRSPNKKKRALYPEWQKILGRDVKWKMAYDRTLPLREIEKGRRFLSQEELEDEIRDRLPSPLKKIPFKVDMASQDPRPLNPLMMGDRQIYVYNPSTRGVSKEALKEFFDYIPAKIILCRIFAPDHRYDAKLAEAAEAVLSHERVSIKTNV